MLRDLSNILNCPNIYQPLKRQTKIAALFFYFYLSKEIRLDVSCESSALKYQVLFSLKNNEKVFMNVVCCSPGPGCSKKNDVVS